MNKTHRLATLLVMALITAACSPGTSEETTTTVVPGSTSTTGIPAATTTTTTPPAVTTTTAAAGAEGAIPESNAGQTLAPYGGEDITAGPVMVYWYRGASGGNYLAVYLGDGIAESDGLGLCPGNSLATATEFVNISNAPSEDGACDGFLTDLGSLQVCDHGVWVYNTKIPGDLEGTLFASLEWGNGTAITGLTSQVQSAAVSEEFEAGLGSYSVPSHFTDDGSQTVTCEAPTG